MNAPQALKAHDVAMHKFGVAEALLLVLVQVLR
jgi:hypothetical protein